MTSKKRKTTTSKNQDTTKSQGSTIDTKSLKSLHDTLISSKDTKTRSNLIEETICDDLVISELVSQLSEGSEEELKWKSLLVVMILNTQCKDSVCFEILDLELLLNTVLLNLSSNQFVVIEIIELITTMTSCMDVTSNIIMKLTGIELLYNVSERRYELECNKNPLYKRKDKKNEGGMVEFLPTLIQSCLTTMENKEESITFLHKSLELLISLLSTIPTRRFLIIYLEDKAFSTEFKLYLQSHPNKLLQETFKTYLMYEKWYISNNVTSSKKQQLQMINTNIQTLQKMVFKYYYAEKKLLNVIFRGVTVLSDSNSNILVDDLDKLTVEELYDLAYRLRIVDNEMKQSRDKEFWKMLFLDRYTLYPTIMDTISSLSLYPNEISLWEDSIIGNTCPDQEYHLPKLNLQYLTLEDYLTRNLLLTLYESMYSIRSDIVNVVKRIDPCERFENGRNTTDFRGWARMGIEVSEVKIEKVGNMLLGTALPSYVHGEFIWDVTKLAGSVKEEWERIQEHDNLFLLWIDASDMDQTLQTQDIADEDDIFFPKRYGIKAIRGCEIIEIKDEDGVVLTDTTQDPTDPKGTKRFIKVAFDSAQYSNDSKFLEEVNNDLYSKFNYIVRRHGRENNFKAVLETIRSLLVNSQDIALPEWMQSIVLGYGDPKMVCKESGSVDFGDTFVSIKHLIDCFPGKKIHLNGKEITHDITHDHDNAKYRVQFKDDSVHATSYMSSPKSNVIPFTPNQVSAIRSGTSPGLTLILGPPGTGKTDVAVQIISNLYHSYPNQKTLLITHSNSALNDIFQKVNAREDIHPRYLLRLGRQGGLEEDFTKTGRVNYLLQRRLELLQDVQLLSESLGISSKQDRGKDGQSVYTCETAGYFYKHHILPRTHSFDTNALNTFPFKSYFQLQELTQDQAHNCIQVIHALFQELAEYHPLELLPTHRQRVDYLLIHQARIIAMTCTHASIIRSHLLSIRFQYDTIIMEESAQMLDIETFITFALQKSNRLKRIVLIGDPYQLPPIIKNRTLAEGCKFEQSFFRRMMRLGVPFVMLDRQGRCRPEIAKLYSWRYPNLSSLEQTHPSFQLANPGLQHTFQFINVQGKESSPTPYFYQNMIEAEYIVNLFQFLLFIGYPCDTISILTAYNGQKELIVDMLGQRCPRSIPFFADVVPDKVVSTIDQYQGQQNDYVLLSLVRTKSIGYLSDMRRWVVALSRARLGLYIFGHKPTFASCPALKPVMDLFTEDQLHLIKGEFYSGVERGVEDEVEEDSVFVVKEVVELSSLVYSLQEQLMVGEEEEEMDVENEENA